MFSFSSFFTWKDLFRSILLGILVGWLLVSFHAESRKRFDYTVTQAPVNLLSLPESLQNA